MLAPRTKGLWFARRCNHVTFSINNDINIIIFLASLYSNTNINVVVFFCQLVPPKLTGNTASRAANAMETIVTPLLESVFALPDSMAANVKNVSEFCIS